MGDFSQLGQQSQNFSQSTAFAAALQRAKQVRSIIMHYNITMWHLSFANYNS